MTHLINLLSWLPGYSGFGSYVQRVVPGIDGLRLQLGESGQAALFTPEQWSQKPPAWASGRKMRFLQRYSLVQHGLDLSALLQRDGINLNQIDRLELLAMAPHKETSAPRTCPTINTSRKATVLPDHQTHF